MDLHDWQAIFHKSYIIPLEMGNFFHEKLGALHGFATFFKWLLEKMSSHCLSVSHWIREEEEVCTPLTFCLLMSTGLNRGMNFHFEQKNYAATSPENPAASIKTHLYRTRRRPFQDLNETRLGTQTWRGEAAEHHCVRKNVVNRFWLVAWNMFYFPIYWEFHNPNWQTHIFQRGRVQPPSKVYNIPKRLDSSFSSWFFAKNGTSPFGQRFRFFLWIVGQKVSRNPWIINHPQSLSQ